MHRVYVHDGEVWTLVAKYALKGPLPKDGNEYAVIETERSSSYQEVCVLTEDGRRLCDIGPEHQHDPLAFYRAERQHIRGD